MTGSTTQDHTTADTHTDTHTGSHKADDTQGGCKKRASSRSAKAGLIIPIAKINNRLCAKKVVPRVGAMAAVQMTGVIQEFAKEILDVAGDFCKSSGKTRLMPEHVLKALRSAIDLVSATTYLMRRAHAYTQSPASLSVRILRWAASVSHWATRWSM